jgi:hypothetical protein
MNDRRDPGMGRRSEDSPRPIQNQILRSLKILTWATVVLYAGLTLAFTTSYLGIKHQQNQLAEVSLSTTHALCTFRNDLATRITSSENFLKTHPDGFAGVPAPVIQNSIDNQQRTLDALSSLHCPPPDLEA